MRWRTRTGSTNAAPRWGSGRTPGTTPAYGLPARRRTTMSARPADYDADPDRFLSSERYPHDDVHPYVAQRFAAAGARTVLDVGGGNGRLARLLPALSVRCVLIDLSATMVAMAPRPAVRADGCRLPVRDGSV